MKLISKSFLSCSLSLLLTGASFTSAGAATPETTTTSPQVLTTLNCTPSSGSAFKESVYAYSVDFEPTFLGFISAYLPFSSLSTVVNAGLYDDGFESCYFGNDAKSVLQNVTFEDETLVSVGTNVGTGPVAAGQNYVLLTASYAGYTLTNAKSPVVPLPSREERAKALAAYKAKGWPPLPR